MKNSTIQFVVGVTVGFISPLLLAEIIRITMYEWYTWSKMAEYPNAYLPILQMGAFGNVIPLFIFNQLKWTDAIKGLIAITLVFAFFILYRMYF